MSNLYARWQASIIKRRLKNRRVVLLSGPRQCGKTTLVRKVIADKDTEFRTLDEKTMRDLAHTDPMRFVKHAKNTLIIDEIQREPELLLAIKQVVDEDTRFGQYLLTGSSNIQALPTVKESLAGRIGKVRLRPLSVGEVDGKEPDFFEKAYQQDFFTKAYEVYDQEILIKKSFRGGFPDAMILDRQERMSWYRDYMGAILERDLQDIQKINRLDAMQKLIYVLASWSGKYMDISGIGAGLSIQRPTLESYINALELLYLIEKVPPWTKTDYGRVGKKEKIFMADTGLMSSILKWDIEQVSMDSDRLGKLFETFIFNELSVQIDVSDHLYTLYHYRDREKREIDFLVEREDGALLGIEVKSSSTAQKKDFKHLEWFRDNLAKDRPFIGIVLYTGEFSGSMGGDMWAVPMSQLWG